MKTKFIIYILLLFSISFLVSCTSTKPISSKKFEGYSKIKQGEIATLEWEFENAKNVKVDSYDKLFEVKDSVKVSPKETKDYKITAFHEADTVAYNWLVEVVDKDDKEVESTEETEEEEEATASAESDTTEKEAKTENKSKGPKYNLSEESSEYAVGSIGPEAAPVRIKIMRNSLSDDTLSMNVVILDENGNFINGLPEDLLDLSFIQKCEKSSLSISDLNVEEIHKIDNSDISIVFDNSAAAEFNFPLLDRILNFSENIDNEDRLMFSYFNHEYKEYISLQPGNEFSESFRDYDLPKPNGLSTLYKSLYTNLVDFTSMSSRENNRAIVFITFSDDNASLIYSPEDIINASKNFGIPVYIIAIGDAYNSYVFEHISDATGGKLYILSEEDMHEAELILAEIHHSLNNYYDVSLQYDNDPEECRNSYSELILKYGEKTLKDNFIISSNINDFHSQYQSLALFEPKGSEIASEYKNNINELASVLKANPSYKIKVIGHSGDEGSTEYNYKISESRAENVKKEMLSKDVNEDQVLTDSEGFSKPIYFLEKAPWQKHYNRRVELKWINPHEEPPFEIIVEQVWTEEEAENSVKKWQKRGYKPYYENFLISNEPVYRVKLWGFSTEDEVKETANKIMNKYDITVSYK